MGEVIICPVCTLFLHKGMSLAAHLDTHPKEQVIKALVLLATIPITTPDPLLDNEKDEIDKTTTLTTNKTLSNDISTSSSSTITQYSSTSNNCLSTLRLDSFHDNCNELSSSLSTGISKSSAIDNTTSTSTGKCNSFTKKLDSHQTNVTIDSRQTTGYSINNNEQAEYNNHLNKTVSNHHSVHLQDLFTYPNKVNKKLPPPPAYGTAISQLRSQNSQSNFIRSTSTTTTTTQNYPATSSYHNVHHHNSGHNYNQGTLDYSLPKNGTSMTLSPRHQKYSQYSIGNTVPTKIQQKSNSPARHFTTPPSPFSTNNTNQQQYKTCQPTTNLNNISQNHSQRQAPSPSVLRFAESPISAQYVERDNGDFIVQESPRHIVQCFEKENGEFSVIEKVLRSPASIVQIDNYIEPTVYTVTMMVDTDDNDTPLESSIKTELDKDCEEKSEIVLFKDEITLPSTPLKKNSNGVKVLSNVKLDPNESLDIMENINKISGSEQFFQSIVQTIKKEEIDTKAINDIELNADNNNIKKQLQNNIDMPSCSGLAATVANTTAATTSVIRLATNNINSKDINIKETNHPSTSRDSKKKFATPTTSRDHIKKPYKKTPKKLIVKFKNQQNASQSKEVSSERISKNLPSYDDDVVEIINLDEPQQLKIPIKKDLEESLNSSNRETIKNYTANENTENDQKACELESDKINIILDMKESVFTIKEISETDECKIEIDDSFIIPDDREVPSTSNGLRESKLLNKLNITDIDKRKDLKETETKNSIKQVDKLSKVLTENIAHKQLLDKSNNENQKSSGELLPIQQNIPGVQHQNANNYNDYPFSFLYTTNGSNSSNETETSTASELQTTTASETSNSNSNHPLTCKNVLSPVFHQHSEATGLFQNHSSYSGPIFQTHTHMNDGEDEKSCYLDLDACSKPNTSCSTTSSGVGVLGSNDHIPLGEALNIRTDEKMPAKGEISEQESNGDIDNSWSQPLFTELAYKFPNPYDHFVSRESWSLSRDDFFAPHDLSTSARSKFIPEKSPHPAGTSSEISITSGIQKKKSHKKLSVELPSSTIPSPLSHNGMSSSLSVPKRKVFKCEHCNLTFSRLKDRNTHLIDDHQYKRVNRRLIRELPSSTVTSASITLQNSIILTEPKMEPIDPPMIDGSIIKTENSSEILITQPTTTLSVENAENSEDKKPLVAVVSTTTDSANYPRTKYDSIRASVYRMLMNFNLSVLQQKREIDVDDKSLFDSKSFCCYTCKRDFISVKLFDEHLAEHAAECFTCGKKFSRWTYFSIHLKRHFGWKDFWCTECDKKFVVRSALIEHMRTHTGAAPLKCNICTKSFKRYSNLTQHKKICHSNRTIRKKEYVCFCGEVLPSKARFIWHKEVHDPKPKCCPWCRDRFVHVNSLRRHIRLTHSDKFLYSEPVECTICKQVYAKSSLKSHMATHSMDTQHECPICNKSFSTKWNLKIHSWVHANRTAKPFKCEHCTKAFVREIDYKNHMNAHKQIRPYTCEYCGCKFIRKYNYMRHRREHHGQKKFSCDLCSKLFHRHYYLIEHRRIHTGERPFLCTICGKSSTTKTNHNKHLKIHHSRDPFTSES